LSISPVRSDEKSGLFNKRRFQHTVLGGFCRLITEENAAARIYRAELEIMKKIQNRMGKADCDRRGRAETYRLAATVGYFLNTTRRWTIKNCGEKFGDRTLRF